MTQVAARLEELIQDKANDTLTPSSCSSPQSTTQSHVASARCSQAAFPIPGAKVAEVDYRDGSGITPVRKRRYAAHDWRSDATNLLVISPTGGRTTYLACALALAACHSEHSVLYSRTDDLARRLGIARGNGITHQKLLKELSNIDLLIIDDFLTVGIESDAASDLFSILANRKHRLPTMIASQTGPAHWNAELPDGIAADSILKRLANNARIIDLGQIDMRRHCDSKARAHEPYWE
ncbi:ATP-binding protein [Cryobacterium sp. Hz9]|uniref:ATP-binding protein n=1 Tax=Cryobacterium sp. Hz9 TaxID=1259167 RepID=UPI001F5442FF|nr:ATP-binding protein [Cryobacterium sp. Hz9]